MSPIKPENKSRYPKNWKEIREAILQECKNLCEFCGIENYSFKYNEETNKRVKVVLTIAHLDHTPENNERENLKALCQKCHLTYDVEHHRKNRSANKYKNLEAKGQERLLP